MAGAAPGAQVAAVAAGAGAAAQVAAKAGAEEAAGALPGAGEVVSEDELRRAWAATRARVARVEASELSGNDAALQADIARCLAALGECDRAARSLQVLSRGERVDEHNVEALSLLLVDFYAGRLSSKQTPGVTDPSGRARHESVRSALAFFEAFLDRAVAMRAAEEPDCELWLARDRARARTGEGEGEDDRALVLAPRAAGSREAKLERFRRARAARQRLDEVVARLRHARMRQEHDDELEREHVLLDLRLAAKTALDEVESLQQESQILEHMARMSLQAPPAQPLAQGGPRGPPQPPAQPFVVTHVGKDLRVTRETIKADMFKPSWRQPTMTLEQLADIEMREARDKEERERAFRAANPEILTAKQLHEQGLEDDLDQADRAAKKDREWDDWKDDNPKGQGVTKRY